MLSREGDRANSRDSAALGNVRAGRDDATAGTIHGFVEIGEEEEAPSGRPDFLKGNPQQEGEAVSQPLMGGGSTPQKVARASLFWDIAADEAGASPSNIARSKSSGQQALHRNVTSPPPCTSLDSEERHSLDELHETSILASSPYRRVRRPSVEGVVINVARTGSAIVSGVVHSLRGQDSDSTEAEVEEKEYRPAGQSTLEDHLKLRAVEKDLSYLNVLQFSSNMESVMRTDMNRFDLLEECRQSFTRVVDDKNTTSEKKKKKHVEGSPGVALQLRDIRCLQGVSEPALLVRRGAIVVSLDPIKAIVTCDRCFVVLPYGADELLEPLMKRFREGNKDMTVEMPFEFIALEALLVTLVNSHAKDVKRRLHDSRTLLRQLKSGITNKMLNRILTMKKAINEMYEAVIGCHETLEEVQGDDDLMGLMCLTAQKEGRHRNHKNTHHSVMQAELLLDAYAIDFLSMAKQLSLMSQEVYAHAHIAYKHARALDCLHA